VKEGEAMKSIKISGSKQALEYIIRLLWSGWRLVSVRRAARVDYTIKAVPPKRT
jgi:hypothetical protein